MVLFLQIRKENLTLLLFVEHIVILQNLIPINPLSLFSRCLFQVFKTATGNRIVSPRINCRNRLLHIRQKLIVRRKCDPGALQRHGGEVIQACDRNFLCLCLIVRPDEERHRKCGVIRRDRSKSNPVRKIGSIFWGRFQPLS